MATTEADLTRFDVVVAGLGITGAATALELARRGLRVLGIDARRPPHGDGASHGRTRIIRQAYYEHPLYVPLVQRAYAGWLALERETGRALLRETGGLHIGPPDGHLIEGVLRSAADHELDHTLLDRAEIRRRFPALATADDDVGVLEPRAGALLAEPCLEACLQAARAGGATLRTGVALEGWTAQTTAVAVHLSSGDVMASRLVLALGPWLPAFVDIGLDVERQTVFWYEPGPGHGVFDDRRVPLVLREYAPDRIVYAFPDFGDGVKCAIHHEGVVCTPDTVNRRPEPDDEMRVRMLLEAMMPGAAGRVADAAVCLYTNTADRHFSIGTREAGRIVVVSACSGHGFKFAPAVAEVVADLVQDRAPQFDLAPFRPGR